MSAAETSTYLVRPHYPPYATPGVFSERIPWHQRRASAYHRPFGAFTYADARPYTPAHLALAAASSRLDPEAVARERDEARKEAEWLEWQGRIATTGGPSTPTTDAGPDGNGDDGNDKKKGSDKSAWAWREIGMCGAARELYFGIALVLFAWAGVLSDTHKRYSVVFDRWYWLRLTAYRQSRWPLVFRRVRRWITVLFCAAALACVAKLEIDEYLASGPGPAVAYRPLPEYQIWSVTAPRCPIQCYNPSKDPWARELEN